MSIRHLVVVAAALAAAGCQPPRPVPAGQPKQDPKQVVAKIGGQNVTAGELDESVKKELSQLEQQYEEQRYQLRRQALEAMLRKRAFEAKAKGRGSPRSSSSSATSPPRWASPPTRRSARCTSARRPAASSSPRSTR
jgi:hypothetical protein